MARCPTMVPAVNASSTGPAEPLTTTDPVDCTSATDASAAAPGAGSTGEVDPTALDDGGAANGGDASPAPEATAAEVFSFDGFKVAGVELSTAVGVGFGVQLVCGGECGRPRC